METPEMSVIVAAMNEEKRLPALLDCLEQYDHRRSEVIVLVDGSTDKTAELAEAWGAKVIGDGLQRMGKGRAILWAFMFSRGRLIVLADADSRHLWMLPQLPALMQRLQADLLVGSRKFIGHKPPLRRRMASRLFKWLTRLLFGWLASDTQCSFKVVKRAILDDLALAIGTRGYAWDVELLARAERKGYHIAELPVFESFSSESKLRLWKDGSAMFFDLLKIWVALNFGGETTT